MVIYISNKKDLQKKINVIKKQGKDSLHIISDFDKTLTKAFVQGQKVLSSYSLIRDGNYLTPDYPARAYAEYEKYHPFEIDPHLSLEEKCAKMQEWWEHHWNIMLECGMNKEVLIDIIKKGKMELREGAEVFFHTLAKQGIPLLIFSSGLGNLIELFLQKKQLLTTNVHIISNFFTFNEQGRAIDFSQPLIHVFNKNEYEIKNTPYYEKVKEKRNVILLGDSLGDLGMSAGLAHDVIIKIGFLNEPGEELLAKYCNAFDVVITDDGSLEPVQQILQEILI